MKKMKSSKIHRRAVSLIDEENMYSFRNQITRTLFTRQPGAFIFKIFTYILIRSIGGNIALGPITHFANTFI